MLHLKACKETGVSPPLRGIKIIHKAEEGGEEKQEKRAAEMEKEVKVCQGR